MEESPEKGRGPAHVGSEQFSEACTRSQPLRSGTRVEPSRIVRAFLAARPESTTLASRTGRIDRGIGGTGPLRSLLPFGSTQLGAIAEDHDGAGHGEVEKMLRAQTEKAPDAKERSRKEGLEQTHGVCFGAVATERPYDSTAHFAPSQPPDEAKRDSLDSPM